MAEAVVRLLGATRRTVVLALLRGALLDLLATGDQGRVAGAVRHQLALLSRTSTTARG